MISRRLSRAASLPLVALACLLAGAAHAAEPLTTSTAPMPTDERLPSGQDELRRKDRPPRAAVRRRVVVVHPRYIVRGGVHYYYRSNDDGRVVEVEVPRGYLRKNRVSLGVGGGATFGVASDRTGYVDPTLLFDLQYRFIEPVGTQLRVGFSGDLNADVRRLQVPIQASVTFNTPSVYPVGLMALVGLSANVFRYDFTGIGGGRTAGLAVGPHAGMGIRFNLGQRADLLVDGRVIRYLTPTGWGEGGASPWQLNAAATANFYF